MHHLINFHHRTVSSTLSQVCALLFSSALLQLLLLGIRSKIFSFLSTHRSWQMSDCNAVPWSGDKCPAESPKCFVLCQHTLFTAAAQCRPPNHSRIWRQRFFFSDSYTRHLTLRPSGSHFNDRQKIHVLNDDHLTLMMTSALRIIQIWFNKKTDYSESGRSTP